MRLVLDPQLGRFSLYYMTDTSLRKFEALFMDQDPRTSVLTLNYNNKTYRLGESEEFTIREGEQPSLIFESSFLTVTQEFAFIATAGSRTVNGVKMSFRIENKTSGRIQAGIRFLLDTKLGESGSTPFTTNTRNIEEETVFGKNTADTFWVSGTSGEFTLMGSLSADVDRVPDLVHIANWKRLNEVPWSLELVQGRKFNNPPYSIRDSAVAYYYEPVRINRGESSSFYLLLASQDTRGFAGFRPSDVLAPQNLAGNTTAPTRAPGTWYGRIGTPESGGVAEVPTGTNATGATAPTAPARTNTPVTPTAPPRTNTTVAPPIPTGTGLWTLNATIARSDYNALQDIIKRIDQSLESGARMSDDEIASIEQDLARIRSRYANL
jgi:hypothetical protein